MTQKDWLSGRFGGSEDEFERWREVAPDGRWSEWFDELYECIDWPEDDGQVEAGQESLS